MFTKSDVEFYKCEGNTGHKMTDCLFESGYSWLHVFLFFFCFLFSFFLLLLNHASFRVVCKFKTSFMIKIPCFVVDTVNAEGNNKEPIILMSRMKF